jgi:hypothetical protein
LNASKPSTTPSSVGVIVKVPVVAPAAMVFAKPFTTSEETRVNVGFVFEKHELRSISQRYVS